MSKTYTDETIHELLPDTTLAGIRGAIADGMPARKIGRTWLYDEDSVRAWLGHREKPTPATAQPQPARLPEVPDHIGDLGDDPPPPSPRAGAKPNKRRYSVDEFAAMERKARKVGG